MDGSNTRGGNDRCRPCSLGSNTSRSYGRASTSRGGDAPTHGSQQLARRMSGSRPPRNARLVAKQRLRATGSAVVSEAGSVHRCCWCWCCCVVVRELGLVLLRRCEWIESKRSRCKKDEDRPCQAPDPLAHGIRPARADGLLVFVVI